MLTDIFSLPSKVRHFLCVTVFFFTCTALILASTGQTVTIRGTVSDPSGAVVPGAKVRARNLATGAVLESTTGAEGGYAISLAAGAMTLNSASPAFSRWCGREWMWLPTTRPRWMFSCSSQCKPRC